MKRSFTIRVNGAEREVAHPATLQGLLRDAGVTVEKMAVELNGRIIHGTELGHTPLQRNDRVEIIQFVGGG